MNILIEGWRGINHSYALVNQWQILELLKLSKIAFKDVPFFNERWNVKENDSGLDEEYKNIINSIKPPLDDLKYDITYRISAPFNFEYNFKSKLLFVFATTEFKNIIKKDYINGDPDDLKNKDELFLHTPSNWSKDGFLKAGFREDQVLVIPHGIDINTFKLITEGEKKIIREKYKFRNDDYILTNIGAMTENKGVEALIAAYGILKKKYKNLKLILKDQSNLYPRKAIDVFNKLLNTDFNKKYKIIYEEMTKDVLIISKNLDFKELRHIYSISDCYVSPYMAEGFNMTPLEAAGCGTQIVVTKGGSTDDYFDNSMGYQIDSYEKKKDGNTMLNAKLDSLIAILEKIINKPDETKLERSKYVHNNFSWEKTAIKLKKEFEKKLSK